MRVMEEVRRDIMSEPGAVAKMKEIEECPEMARTLAKIDGYDFKRKTIEFKAVVESLAQSVIARDERKWRVAAATYLIFLKRWPELFTVEEFFVGKHGPN
jgi:hypothetical protein